MARLTKERRCACGCGTVVPGRALYVPTHRAILIAARRRLREARRAAERRGIHFALDLEDVIALVATAWPADAGLALRRVDRNQGFVRENVELVRARGGRRRGVSRARLERRLERLAMRVDLYGVVTTEELALIFARQAGRCAVSGRVLLPLAGVDDPDGMRLLLINPGSPPSRKNLMFVTALIEHGAARWGLDAFVAHAMDVALAARPTEPTTKRQAKSQRAARTTR